jgi:hypothetical protein
MWLLLLPGSPDNLPYNVVRWHGASIRRPKRLVMDNAPRSSGDKSKSIATIARNNTIHHALTNMLFFLRRLEYIFKFFLLYSNFFINPLLSNPKFFAVIPFYLQKKKKKKTNKKQITKNEKKKKQFPFNSVGMYIDWTWVSAGRQSFHSFKIQRGNIDDALVLHFLEEGNVIRIVHAVSILQIWNASFPLRLTDASASSYCSYYAPKPHARVHSDSWNTLQVTRFDFGRKGSYPEVTRSKNLSTCVTAYHVRVQ